MANYLHCLSFVSRNFPVARASCAFTVPTLTSRTSAIWASDISSANRSKNTERCWVGSDDTTFKMDCSCSRASNTRSGEGCGVANSRGSSFVDRSTNDEPREFATPQPSPERVLLAREQLQSILNVVSSLPTQQRSVFLLRFAEEMSLAQIADVLDVKVGTVKAQLARATGKLRETKERQWR